MSIETEIVERSDYPQKSSPDSLYQTIRKDFLKAGVKWTAGKKQLSPEMIKGSCVGTIVDDEDKRLYEIEIFREKNNYNIRGDIPPVLNLILLAKNIDNRCLSDSTNPPKEEVIHHLHCNVSTTEELQIFTQTTKEFHQIEKLTQQIQSRQGSDQNLPPQVK